ncbi:MAG TPA: hypothetical protein VM867_11255 [Xanthobacteraceae bacterium]|jgi:hypothetical protein|nr:hypothetical protein [Xanthobacteraceae bacterium]
MTPYWFVLRSEDGTKREIGVTARDWDDAILLMKAAMSGYLQSKFDEAMIDTWSEVRNVDELDQNHVVPNMGVMLRRGVWFPNLPHIQ